jgi:hypothetical protein
VADSGSIVRVVECPMRATWSVLAVGAETERLAGERIAALLRHEPLAVAQFGPGEWLLMADGFQAAASGASDKWSYPMATLGERIEALEYRIESLLRELLQGLDCDVQVISDAWTVWRLEGPVQALRAVISQGTMIDPWDESARARGGYRCALGPFNVMIRAIDDGPSVDISVERSYSEALGTWLRRRAGRTAGSSGGGIDARGVDAGT